MARPKLDAPNFRLVQRGSRFYVRWWQDGQWHRVSTGTADRAQAGRILANFVAGHATPAAPAVRTIGAILDGYLADRKPRVAAYATLVASCAALRRHLGDLDPASLTRERGRLYAKQRRAEGHTVGPVERRTRKPTSDGTIIREIVTLRAALRWAVQEQWITAAPYVPSPASPPPRGRWLTRAEFDALIAAAGAPIRNPRAGYLPSGRYVASPTSQPPATSSASPSALMASGVKNGDGPVAAMRRSASSTVGMESATRARRPVTDSAAVRSL